MWGKLLAQVPTSLRSGAEKESDVGRWSQKFPPRKSSKLKIKIQKRLKGQKASMQLRDGLHGGLVYFVGAGLLVSPRI